MNVETAQPADAPEIASVARRAWHAAYGEFLSTDAIDATVDEWYAPASLRGSIGRDGSVFVVAVDGEGRGDETVPSARDDRIVGFLNAGYSEAVGNVVLSRIYTLPDYWGSGVGTAMLGRVARRLVEAGYDRISAVVLADNDVGRSFYDARAFEEIGRQTTTFGGEEREEVIVAADLADLTDIDDREQ
ncbi:MAG: acetyltransferase [halophilic archaeon J07HB67]|jgi:Acetyltransferases|nr:MAG: acetyltransferase [halophilic archaeon J07HB67]